MILYEVPDTTKENQIEDEKQLEELTNSGDHISKNFHEYERKKEEEKTECLQERVSFFEKNYK